MYNVNRYFHQYCVSFPSNKPPKCQNWIFDNLRQKMEIMFVYLRNTSHFIHFQSVRQPKWNIHNKTNKYRWHFRSKPHKTTSLRVEILSAATKYNPNTKGINDSEFWICQYATDSSLALGYDVLSLKTAFNNMKMLDSVHAWGQSSLKHKLSVFQKMGLLWGNWNKRKYWLEP